MSRSGERGGMVYVQASGSEAREVLARIEERLQALGAGKSRLLTARVLLSDMGLFDDYDRAWNEWLGPQPRPLRVHRLAERAEGERLVDITVTGLRMRASPSRSPHVQGRSSQG